MRFTVVFLCEKVSNNYLKMRYVWWIQTYGKEVKMNCGITLSVSLNMGNYFSSSTLNVGNVMKFHLYCIRNQEISSILQQEMLQNLICTTVGNVMKFHLQYNRKYQKMSLIRLSGNFMEILPYATSQNVKEMLKIHVHWKCAEYATPDRLKVTVYPTNTAFLPVLLQFALMFPYATPYRLKHFIDPKFDSTCNITFYLVIGQCA